MDLSEIRDLEKWGKENIEYSTLASFLQDFQPKTAIHTVWYEGYPIDFLMDYKPGKPLVFIWKGNTRRKKDTKLPIFVGFRMITADDATRISISDPTMYLNERLGLSWYAGSDHHKFQNAIAEIVKCIGEKINGKIIHTGGSGGGFAALFFSKFNKGALAVPFNPQTNFLNYEQSAVDLYLKSCFSGNDIGYAKQYLKNYLQHDLVDFYRRNSSKNYILYLQNINDTHVNEHLEPFLASFGRAIKKIPGVHNYKFLDMTIFLSDEWDKGHNPPTDIFLRVLFKKLLNDYRDFDEIVADQEFLMTIPNS